MTEINQNNQTKQALDQILEPISKPIQSIEISKESKDFRPKITVVGVGGAGCNAVNNMIRSQLEGVEFVVMNTDAQALVQSLAERRVHLGQKLTQGLGAGSSPQVGKDAAEESHEEITKQICGSHMVFIAAGAGGGTGTGASPVIARIARDLGILTVAVVTKPFNFEGGYRMKIAEMGIEELQSYVDTIIVVPNQNLFRAANPNTTFSDAFKMGDDVLYAGVRSITDLMIMPGLINLDFADVRTVMKEMGKAMMGTGEAQGEGRAVAAAETAIANPLLDDVSIEGANAALISITGGMDMTLFEADEAANCVRRAIKREDANIIVGATFEDKLSGIIRVSVVATGIPQTGAHQFERVKERSSLKETPTQSPQGVSTETPKNQSNNQGDAQVLEVPQTPKLSDGLKTSPQDKSPSPHVLHLTEGEEDSFSNELKRESQDRYIDTTEEESSHKLAAESPHKVFSQELTEKNLFLDPSDKSGEEESSQMTIPFERSPNKAPFSPQMKKGEVSSGGFLSRFLKGRFKNPGESPVQGSQEKTSQEIGGGQRTPDISSKLNLDDELDVPTFMRKKGDRNL